MGIRPSRVLQRCRRHRERLAAWQCERCAFFHCADCARERRELEVVLAVCPCGGRCRPFVFEDVRALRRRPVDEVLDSLAWPLRGTGVYVLGFAALVPVAAALVAAVFSLLRTAAAFACFGFGLLFACALVLHVIERSSLRPSEDLGWPDLENFYTDVLGPGLRVFCSLFLCFGPGLYVRYGRGAVGAGVALLVVGAWLWPFTLQRLAIDGWRGMDPLALLRTVAGAGRDSLVVSATCTAACLLAVALQLLLARIPLLGPALCAATSLYLVAVVGRLLGLLERRRTAG